MIHRASTTSSAFDALDEPVVFPVHPRTRNAIKESGHSLAPHVMVIEPVGYLDMVRLEQSARLILTDSGGVQKEAYWLGKPCVTLRDETEWIETVHAGWNVLAGADTERIVLAARSFIRPAARPPLYGDAHAADRIKESLFEDSVSIKGGHISNGPR